MKGDSTVLGDSPTAEEDRRSEAPDYPGADRRTKVAFKGPDRRKFTWKTIVYGALKPRRQQVRRDADNPTGYVDIHETNLLVVAAWILVLSVLDGLLAVHLSTVGAIDLNPALDALVRRDTVQFAIVKWLLTAFAVVALILSERAYLFGKIRGAWVLYALAFGYSFMVAYSASLAIIYG